MSKFLTYKTELIQSEEESIWITAHNQLFQDYDGNIYLTPRFFATDGYTIDDKLSPFAGNRMEYDIRPAVQHDWECRYKFVLILKITEYELRQLGLLKTIWKEIGENRIQIDVCEDIPIKYLKVISTKFNDTNKRFERMLNCIDGMSKFKKKLISMAVYFNIGWFTDETKKFNVKNLYKKVL